MKIKNNYFSNIVGQMMADNNYLTTQKLGRIITTIK